MQMQNIYSHVLEAQINFIAYNQMQLCILCIIFNLLYLKDLKLTQINAP